MSPVWSSVWYLPTKILCAFFIPPLPLVLDSVTVTKLGKAKNLWSHYLWQLIRMLHIRCWRQKIISERTRQQEIQLLFPSLLPSAEITVQFDCDSKIVCQGMKLEMTCSPTDRSFHEIQVWNHHVGWMKMAVPNTVTGQRLLPVLLCCPLLLKVSCLWLPAAGTMNAVRCFHLASKLHQEKVRAGCELSYDVKWIPRIAKGLCLKLNP